MTLDWTAFVGMVIGGLIAECLWHFIRGLMS